jgi:hypothetical protein
MNGSLSVKVNRSLTFKVVLCLATLQGIFGLVRAYNWVRVGVDFFGQGVLVLPLIGAITVMRGLFISAVAALYVFSVIGALQAKGWAWWTCLIAVVLNLCLVLAGLAQGGPLVEAIAWSVIPLILFVIIFLE